MTRIRGWVDTREGWTLNEDLGGCTGVGRSIGKYGIFIFLGESYCHCKVFADLPFSDLGIDGQNQEKTNRRNSFL